MSATHATSDIVRGSRPPLLPWWMTHIVKVTMAHQPMADPQINITTLRRVQDTSHCFLLAMDGDIEGVRSLLLANKALAKDVAATTGYTILIASSNSPSSIMLKLSQNLGRSPRNFFLHISRLSI